MGTLNNNNSKSILFIFIIVLSLISFVQTTSTSSSSLSPVLINEEDNSNETPITKTCDSSFGCGSEASKLILVFLMVLFFSVMVVYFISTLNIHYLPDSICLVLYGVIVGLIGKYSNSQLIEHVSSFDVDKFFLFLLPIIIFETGFSLPKIHFFKNLPSILILATFGTVIAFSFTGLGIYLVGAIKDIKGALIISGIGCATDPVATLAIFKALDVEPVLYMIVLGESILNDAVSIIIFQSVLTYSITEIWKPILLFIVLSIGSISIGIITSLLLALLLKHFDIGKYPALETIFMIIFSYTSYFLSESIGLSGILASFFSGMTMSQYGYKNLSSETKHTITQLYRTGAFIGETIAFIYIGISLPIHDFHINVPLIILSIVFFMISRAISIFPTFYLLNRFKFSNVPKPIQFVIWFSGLRGTISFSLSLSESFSDMPTAPEIRTTILILVYFTLFAFGMGTFPLLKFLNIKINSSVQTLESISKEYENESKFKNIGSFMKKLNLRMTIFFGRSNPPPEINKSEDDQDSSSNGGNDENEAIIQYDSGDDIENKDSYIEMETYADDDTNGNNNNAILITSSSSSFSRPDISNNNNNINPGKTAMIKSHSTSSLRHHH